MAFVRARVNKVVSYRMHGSELLYQYVIVFTSCFVRECNDFQLFFYYYFLMMGPALWIVICRSKFFKKKQELQLTLKLQKLSRMIPLLDNKSTWTGAWCCVITHFAIPLESSVENDIEYSSKLGARFAFGIFMMKNSWPRY